MRKVYKIILILLDRNSLFCSAHLLSDSTHANLFEKTRTHLYIQSNLEILTLPTHSSYFSPRYLISKMPSDSDNEVISISTSDDKKSKRSSRSFSTQFPTNFQPTSTQLSYSFSFNPHPQFYNPMQFYRSYHRNLYHRNFSYQQHVVCESFSKIYSFVLDKFVEKSNRFIDLEHFLFSARDTLLSWHVQICKGTFWNCMRVLNRKNLTVLKPKTFRFINSDRL